MKRRYKVLIGVGVVLALALVAHLTRPMIVDFFVQLHS
jgi:hypothetical protein